MSKRKKIAIISTIVVISFIVMGIVYAFLNEKIEIKNPITIGSVKIKDLNLQITKSNGEQSEVSQIDDLKHISMEPADIDTISWTTENIGTSGVLTRHTLEIYWQDDVGENANDLLYLYPANMSKEAIRADYKKIASGETSQYLLATEKVSKQEDGITKYGIKYKFVGDALNGADGKEVSNEVDYNSDVETIIDSTINTDDESKVKDEIAFRLLLSPKTSYLLQGKGVKATVTTEAMQYTEAGSASWTVVDTISIP